jgi:putative FmdB family regulatory protein
MAAGRRGGGQFYEGDGFMPVYEYQCVDCGEVDQRVGGLDDHAAICALCGSLMLRLNEDVFLPYFENRDELPEVSVVAEIGEFLGETRSGGHVYGEPLLLRPAASRAALAGATTPSPIFQKS